MHRLRNTTNPQGNILIISLIVIGLLVVGATTSLVFVTNQHKLAKQETYREQSLAIAEAGIEYYRWHLAHVPDDFVSDTGLHEFKNAFGEVIGYYNLEVTPPSGGSTVVTIKSTGYTVQRPNLKRSITIQLGIPSFARYAVVADDFMRFGEGTEVFGPIHSNFGIRFDGLAHNLVTSAVENFNDPDHTGGNEWGVHTHVSPTDPLPPTAMPSRPDVFEAGRDVGVAALPFESITLDLANLKSVATTGGIYLGPSGGEGYHITFNTNDTVDIRIVNTELQCQYRSGSSWYSMGYCSNNYERLCTQDSSCRYCSGDPDISCSSNFTCWISGAGSCVSTGVSCVQSNHSIGTRAGDESSFTYQGSSSLGVAMPANGIFFVEDDVWVDGQIDGQRVTLAAAREPLASGTADIYLNRDLLYTHYDGTDVIGLIAQSSILVGYFSEDDLKIDAAVMAQNGRVSRPYFGYNYSTWRLYPTGSPDPLGEASCANYRARDTITTFGSLGTNLRYGFAWVGSLFSCGGGEYNQSGYCTRNLNFDPELTFAPPPLFPTTGEYTVLSWEEE